MKEDTKGLWEEYDYSLADIPGWYFIIDINGLLQICELIESKDEDRGTVNYYFRDSWGSFVFPKYWIRERIVPPEWPERSMYSENMI